MANIQGKALHRYVSLSDILKQYLQAETLFGERHGCQPMRSVYPCKKPFGLDVLSAQYKANAEKRLLAFQQPYLDDLGPNLELKILGSVGMLILDVMNGRLIQIIGGLHHLRPGERRICTLYPI